VNFNGSITELYHHERLRAFTICPGPMKTGMFLDEEWKSFAEKVFTPIEVLMDAMMKPINGGDIKDAKGR